MLVLDRERIRLEVGDLVVRRSGEIAVDVLASADADEDRLAPAGARRADADLGVAAGAEEPARHAGPDVELLGRDGVRRALEVVRVRREEAVAVGLVVLRPDERGSAGQQRQREQHGDHAEDDHHDPGDASTAHAADPSPAGCSAGFRRGSAARAAPSRSPCAGAVRGTRGCRRGAPPRRRRAAAPRAGRPSIVCSSQCRGARPPPPSDRTSSSRVVCSRHAAPSRPSRTTRWTVASMPPCGPARGLQGLAIFGDGSLRAPLPSSTATSASPLTSNTARIRSAGVRRVTTPPGRGRRPPPAGRARRTGRETKKAEREARVIVASIAPTSRSRVAASAASWRAPCALNGSRRSGVSPACAPRECAAEVERDRHLLVEPDRRVEQDGGRLQQRAVTRGGHLEASSGAISASASTRPEVSRADGQRPAARQPGARVERGCERIGTASPSPAPQRASAQTRDATLERAAAQGRRDRREQRRPRTDRGQARKAPLERPRRPARQREDAHDRRTGDRRVTPDADHQQDGEEEHSDERAEEQAEADVRRNRAPQRRPPALLRDRTRGEGEGADSPSAATGACKTKMARHSKAWVSTPPSAGPSASAERPRQHPDRRPRRRSPSERRAPAASPARSNAAPTPCTRVRRSRNSTRFASAHAIDAPRKTTRPKPTTGAARTGARTGRAEGGDATARCRPSPPTTRPRSWCGTGCTGRAARARRSRSPRTRSRRRPLPARPGARAEDAYPELQRPQPGGGSRRPGSMCQ